jgi:hypothetical protein
MYHFRGTEIDIMHFLSAIIKGNFKKFTQVKVVFMCLHSFIDSMQWEKFLL